MTKQALEQRHSIQILRAVAASTVAYLHTFTEPLFGSFGVDLFFVISGFVMCMVIRHSNPSPAVFLVDRTTRIVPLYWAVTTILLLVAWLAPNLMGSTIADFGNYLKSLFFIPHFRRDGTMFPMLIPGWSLNYEMFYYAIIGLVLVVERTNFVRRLALVLLLIYPLSNFLDPATALGMFLQETLWVEFVLGIACFHLYQLPLLQRIPKVVVLLLILGTYLAMIQFEGTADRLWASGIPSFFILLLALQLDGSLRRLDAKFLRFIVHIGDASYATYLSHLFTIGFVERVVFTRFGLEKDTGTAWLIVACCLLVGSALYHLVDKPLTRRARLFARKIGAYGTMVPAH